MVCLHHYAVIFPSCLWETTSQIYYFLLSEPSCIQSLSATSQVSSSRFGHLAHLTSFNARSNICHHPRPVPSELKSGQRIVGTRVHQTMCLPCNGFPGGQMTHQRSLPCMESLIFSVPFFRIRMASRLWLSLLSSIQPKCSSSQDSGTSL